MAVVPIQVKDGYFIHKLQKTLPVEAGDIFGFTTAAGRLAFRNVCQSLYTHLTNTALIYMQDNIYKS